MTTRDQTGRVRLEVLEVAEPCGEDWDAMRGDDRVRACDLCHRNVYDLSALPRDEAEALVEAREGRLCVRFVRRADGTVTTSDCAPDRMAALRRAARRSLAVGAAATAGLMAVIGFLGAASALGLLAGRLSEPDPVVMGMLPYVPPPEPAEGPLLDDEEPGEGVHLSPQQQAPEHISPQQPEGK